MNVRPLTQNDIPFLTSVRADFPDAWNEEMLLSAVRAGNFYGFIANDCESGKNAPVGFITYSMSINTADLQDLYVLKAFRGRGIGKALVKEFISGAEKMGAKKFFLEVRESNLPAQNLYRSAGFKKLSVREKYYEGGENALVFIKEL